MLRYLHRWQLEVAFQAVRTRLGVQTQRQWSALAIARTTPACARVSQARSYLRRCPRLGAAHPLDWSIFRNTFDSGTRTSDSGTRTRLSQLTGTPPLDSLGVLALEQYLDDAFRRFGTIMLAKLQMSIHNLKSLLCQVTRESSRTIWFNLSLPVQSTVHIAFDPT